MALTSNLPSGFRGLHAWHLGTSLEWLEPIRRDRTFKAIDTYESLTEVDSSYVGGHTWDQVIRSEIYDAATNDLVVVQRLFIRRFERDRGRKVAKEMRQRTRYSPDELRAVAEETLNEYRRGAKPFAAEDVVVGDSIGSIVRGPLTSVDCLAFVRGWGGAYILAHGSMWEFVAKHPGAFPPDSSGVPDSPERTHWSDEFARAVGAPMAFDYGPQRIAWCGTLITNWMGDAALLRSLNVRLRKPNYHGDIVRISGKVTAVDFTSGMVTIGLEGHNQLTELVVEGDAVVDLGFAAPSTGRPQ
jgi:hypothetical protein